MVPETLWEPRKDGLQQPQIGHYLHWLEDTRQLKFADYNSLYEWSISDLTSFWSSIWDYGAIQASVPYEEVMTRDPMPETRWFIGAKLNYAQHVLGDRGEAIALRGRSNTRGPVDWSFNELRDQVARVRAGLVRLGVGKGDRVAAFVPNLPEGVALLLASASLGACFASCSPEFGVRSVVDRFAQIEPKVLFVVDGYHHKGRPIRREEQNRALIAALPTVENVVGLSYIEPSVPILGMVSWNDFTAESGPLEFEQVDVDHPLYVLYSSGTTGIPKAIVHGHGLILIEHIKGLRLQMDVGEGDVIFQPATTSWMVWNYAISALSVGASMVCFDGDVSWPDTRQLWGVAEETQATHLTSASAILMASAKAGVRPVDEFDLSPLRVLTATGSPFPKEGFHWVYDSVKSDVQLTPGSGGTDICSAFVGGCPILPVVAGEIAGRYLGAAVDAFDESGHSVRNQVGELVITQPMPSMPVRFWGDPQMKRYRSSYFEKYPGVWRHGDWIIITDRGTCQIMGRSDSTLNRGGVRLGTSEFDAVVDAMPEVQDSVVVHIEDDQGGNGELVLLVALADGVSPSTKLSERISSSLKTELSPRHIPDTIEFVSALPRTLTGKKLEIPIKKILKGSPVDQVIARDAITNPESVDVLVSLAERRQRITST